MKKRLVIIIISFILSFLIMMGLSFVSVKRFGALIHTIDNVERSHNVIAQLNLIEITIKDIDRFERGYMITHDSSYIRLLAEPCGRLLPLTEKLQKAIAGDPAQHGNLIWIRSYVVSRLDDLRLSLRFADTAVAGSVPVHFYDGRVSMQQCMDFLQKMRRTEQALLAQQHRNKLFYQQLTSANLRYLFLGFSGITLILFFLMIRELRSRFRYQEKLQEKLIDLRQSHHELEQIAFAASHHLQEPLRKMQVFLSRLELQHSHTNGESRELMERIHHAATRMQELIEGLANLTSLVGEQGKPEKTDLDQVMRQAVAELRTKITETRATIHQDQLPVIQGYPDQILLLFKALLDNALKYARENVPPVIIIKSNKISGDELAAIDSSLKDHMFYCISVSDNGIGFQNQFIHKMFLLFQRLHNQHSIYEGKGTGLALSQRVMTNHKGYILAHGRPGEGATFRLYIPVDA